MVKCLVASEEFELQSVILRINRGDGGTIVFQVGYNIIWENKNKNKKQNKPNKNKTNQTKQKQKQKKLGHL